MKPIWERMQTPLHLVTVKGVLIEPPGLGEKGKHGLPRLIQVILACGDPDPDTVAVYVRPGPLWIYLTEELDVGQAITIHGRELEPDQVFGEPRRAVLGFIRSKA